MGREVRRVPLDFDWPIDKTWGGFLNPHYKKCPDCDHGETASCDALNQLVHLIMIAGSNSASRKPPHSYLRQVGIESVGTTLHEVSVGLAGRPMSFIGHDAIDRWQATKKILLAAGLPEDWGTCKTCNGRGIDPTIYEAYSAWEPTEPPKGDGWQLWETVSEGSPVTPVFETPEQLAQHLVENPSGIFKCSYEDWLQMITGSGWAPSMLGSADKGIMDGVTGMAMLDKKESGDERQS